MWTSNNNNNNNKKTTNNKSSFRVGVKIVFRLTFVICYRSMSKLSLSHQHKDGEIYFMKTQ